MSLHDLDQRRAADPRLNAFVTANAGSGKTKTLIDRVARLLLRDVKPASILCVTYTKAAAAEMQRRLFDVLGGWSVMPDDELRAKLFDLEGDDAPRDGIGLSNARTLFAKALETPGGLKIQTIHAFCEKLLRRFPVEAGVSPGFTVMDDQAAALIAAEARAAVAHHAMDADDLVTDAYSRLSVALDFDRFQQMFAAFETRREAIAAYVEGCGGLGGLPAAVAEACGLAGLEDPDSILREALLPPALDREAWKRLMIACLASRNENDVAKGEKVAEIVEAAALGEDRETLVLGILFTDKGEARARSRIFTKAIGEPLKDWLETEQARIGAALERARAARVAQDTVLVLALASVYAHEYEIAKASRGALDFADLIGRTRDLVAERPDAAWVLYKLDDGVDHILVDEAQDTAPEQWDIVRRLTGEFWSGAGLRNADVERTLFVVGDEKQSIYSFQGADPQRLLEETRLYVDHINEVRPNTAAAVPLQVSYRSTPQVLTFVDTLFVEEETRAGVPPPEGQNVVEHRPFRADHNGCVDLWPLEREEKGDEPEAWDAPLDEEAEASANRRLARRIASEIKALVERGDAVFDKEQKTWRPAGYGDVIVLVRRRKVLFEEVIRALKQSGAPVAGADRLTLSAHIAFDDLMALARFVQFPDDDLTLAALLKSPFCGLGDDDVYALAKTRRPDTLWTVLQRRAGEQPAWRAALEVLRRAHELAPGRAPFDFYTRMLGLPGPGGRSIRACMLTRLGAEAGDVLDEFLARALAAEAQGVRDLETLAHAFAGLDIAVKREMEGAGGEVRVMTAHGAKGLEAPIVFLPETTLTRSAAGSPLLATADGGFLWCAKKDDDCAASAAARELRVRREEEEAWRLLYVGLTRARDRLVLCGRIDARTADEKVGGWYAAMRRAFAHPSVSPGVRIIAGADGFTFQRFGPDPERLSRSEAAASAPSPLPDWAGGRAPVEPPARRYASPSQLAEQTYGPSPSPLAMVEGLGRYRRGELIHRLLQLLPDVPVAGRRAAAERMLARERDLTDPQRREMLAAAFGVLDDTRFADVFGPGSRAEAAIAGTSPRLPAGLAVSGRVDRLLVTPDRVLVVDYKTNRPAPGDVADADPAYLIQMSVYTAVLEEIFPDRRVEAALVWTDGPRLMPVPENIVAATLAALPGAH